MFSNYCQAKFIVEFRGNRCLSQRWKHCTPKGVPCSICFASYKHGTPDGVKTTAMLSITQGANSKGANLRGSLLSLSSIRINLRSNSLQLAPT
jgi:hypothetical protein